MSASRATAEGSRLHIKSTSPSSMSNVYASGTSVPGQQLEELGTKKSTTKTVEPRSGPSKGADYTVIWETEVFWRDHQAWLAEKGYMLRPRYHPGWKPSWNTEESFYPRRYEDGVPSSYSFLLDATRISDGKVVILKKVSHQRHPDEINIATFLSSEPLKSHPRNHCVPILEVLRVPDDEDLSILVMPLLRPFNDPCFQSVGEVMEFLRQIFEGLQFMHQCRIAHRDCMDLNIMMDPEPLFPELYHPVADHMKRDFSGKAKKPHTRVARPTKYYVIDFGLAVQYSYDDPNPVVEAVLGGDKSAPELQGSPPPIVNPFPTDVYYLGNMVRETFLQPTTGLEFMKPLVDDMVRINPAERPSMDEVIARFGVILRSLHWWKLRSRLIENVEEGKRFLRLKRQLGHFFRTVAHVLTFKSALPVPRY